MPDPTAFAFSVAPEGTRWKWCARQIDGRVAHGEAPTRAAAAAFVIRILARNHIEAAKPAVTASGGVS